MVRWLVVLLLGTGCGRQLCDDTRSAQRRLLAGQTTCSTQGRTLEVLGLECRERASCSSADALFLDDYVRCLNLQEPCRVSNEPVTLDGAARCATTLRTAVSPACAASL